MVDECKDLGRCDCAPSLRQTGRLQPLIVGADLEAVRRICLDVLELNRVPEQRREGFRVIFADHRGHGRCDKPHDPAAYAMTLRVADAVAILDRLGIERAHYVGRSWGGRLCFGIGEHAAGRVRSLVIGGNQPYVWPDSPISRSLRPRDTEVKD